jgi:hypothetical protein
MRGKTMAKSLEGKWATYYGDDVLIIRDKEDEPEVTVSMWATGEHENLERDELENIRNTRKG